MLSDQRPKNIISLLYIPNASSCFLPDPAGLPLPFLDEEGSDEWAAPPPESPCGPTVEVEKCPTVGEVVERPRAMLLLLLASGEYFLGLPLFFLAASMVNPPPVPNPEEDPSPPPAYWCWEVMELKGKRGFWIEELGGLIMGAVLVLLLGA